MLPFLVSDATKHPKFYYSPFPVWELDGKDVAVLVSCRGPASAGSRGYSQDERRRLERTHETSLDRAKSAREGERKRERE